MNHNLRVNKTNFHMKGRTRTRFAARKSVLLHTLENIFFIIVGKANLLKVYCYARWYVYLSESKGNKKINSYT